MLGLAGLISTSELGCSEGPAGLALAGSASCFPPALSAVRACLGLFIPVTPLSAPGRVGQPGSEPGSGSTRSGAGLAPTRPGAEPGLKPVHDPGRKANPVRGRVGSNLKSGLGSSMLYADMLLETALHLEHTKRERFWRNLSEI